MPEVSRSTIHNFPSPNSEYFTLPKSTTKDFLTHAASLTKSIREEYLEPAYTPRSYSSTTYIHETHSSLPTKETNENTDRFLSVASLIFAFVMIYPLSQSYHEHKNALENVKELKTSFNEAKKEAISTELEEKVKNVFQKTTELLEYKAKSAKISFALKATLSSSLATLGLSGILSLFSSTVIPLAIAGAVVSTAGLLWKSADFSVSGKIKREASLIEKAAEEALLHLKEERIASTTKSA